MHDIKTDYDLLIAGGGMVGSALACALGDTDLKIALLEGTPLERIRPTAELDIRVSAISRASQRIKQMTGNPEAVASAYSLLGYDIAADLGGEAAFLNLRDRARANRYSAVVHVWISPNGEITRVELANSSGTAEIDEALRQAIAQIHGRLKPPPERMPQPLKIRIRT